MIRRLLGCPPFWLRVLAALRYLSYVPVFRLESFAWGNLSFGQGLADYHWSRKFLEYILTFKPRAKFSIF